MDNLFLGLVSSVFVSTGFLAVYADMEVREAKKQYMLPDPYELKIHSTSVGEQKKTEPVIIAQ